MKGRWSQDVYTRVFKYAARAHDGQKEPGSGLPYLVHVALVSMEIMAALMADPEANGDLALQCSLLHDTIEDTETTYEDLNKEYGKVVADGVLALTKEKAEGSGEGRHFAGGNKALSDSLSRIKKQPREVWMVKMADRVVNLQPPPPAWSKEKIENYGKQAVEIHDALKDASAFLAKRLAIKIEEYRLYPVDGKG